MWKKFIAWFRELLGCAEDAPTPTVNLYTGINELVYTLQERDAMRVCSRLIANGSLISVRYQDSTGDIEELYKALFPHVQWVNEIGTLKTGETYYIKVNRNVNKFSF